MCAQAMRSAVERGVYKLERVFDEVAGQLGPASVWVADAEAYADAGADGTTLERWFSNVNTPGEMAEVEAWLKGSR